jgi:ribosomal protein S19
MLIRKRNLSRVTPFFFRSFYGSKFANLSKLTVVDENSLNSPLIPVIGKKKNTKKSKKLKSIKKSKAGFVFLFNKNIYLPITYRKKRISVYTGKTFFSFIVKLKYVYTRLSEFVSTKNLVVVFIKKL